MQWSLKIALTLVGLSAVTALSPAARAQNQAPDYYVDAVFHITTAERLAQFCPTVVLNTDHAQAQSDVLLDRLSEDGLGDASEVEALPGLVDGVTLRQDAFMLTYSLAGAGPDAVCAAAQAEIDAGSALGAYLMAAPVTE